MASGSYFFETCRQEGCDARVLSGGRYCMSHQTRDDKQKAGLNLNRTPTSGQIHAIGKERNHLQHPPRASQQHAMPTPARLNTSINPTIQSSLREKSGDAITVKIQSSTASPNAKKQLPDKHVARKSGQNKPLGLSTSASPVSTNQSPLVERPAKKPRLPGDENPRNNVSSFTPVNSHPVQGSPPRESEDGIHKRSAIQAFYLRSPNRMTGGTSGDAPTPPPLGQSLQPPIQPFQQSFIKSPDGPQNGQDCSKRSDDNTSRNSEQSTSTTNRGGDVHNKKNGIKILPKGPAISLEQKREEERARQHLRQNQQIIDLISDDEDDNDNNVATSRAEQPSQSQQRPAKREQEGLHRYPSYPLQATPQLPSFDKRVANEAHPSPKPGGLPYSTTGGFPNSSTAPFLPKNVTSNRPLAQAHSRDQGWENRSRAVLHPSSGRLDQGFSSDVQLPVQPQGIREPPKQGSLQLPVGVGTQYPSMPKFFIAEGSTPMNGNTHGPIHGPIESPLPHTYRNPAVPLGSQTLAKIRPAPAPAPANDRPPDQIHKTPSREPNGTSRMVESRELPRKTAVNGNTELPRPVPTSGTRWKAINDSQTIEFRVDRNHEKPTSHIETTHHGVSAPRPEPLRHEPSRLGPSRLEPSRPEPSRPEPSRPGPSRPEKPVPLPQSSGLGKSVPQTTVTYYENPISRPDLSGYKNSVPRPDMSGNQMFVPQAETFRHVQPVLRAGLETNELAETPGNLSALLQQRKRPWKQLSPEERRQIWVAEHDPVKFDSYIYGPLNAPYHPKDPRFGLPEIRYPEPRPVRPATHFMHLDARVHYSKRYSSDWHHDKQKEIRGRGNRKAKENFGRAAARSAAVAPTRPSKKLPKHVRENPKWMEALAELDEMADRAQARKRENAREKEHTEGKGKPRSGKRGQKIRQTNTRENVEEEGGAPAESSPKPGPKNDATKGDKGKGKDVEQHTPEGKGKEKETISQRPRPRYMLPRVETESEYEDADDEMDWD